MNVARLGNKYLADEEPWKMKKTDEGRVQTNVCRHANCSCFEFTLRAFLTFTATNYQILK
jgi:methionyl-tRNA synthetase